MTAGVGAGRWLAVVMQATIAQKSVARSTWATAQTSLAAATQIPPIPAQETLSNGPLDANSCTHLSFSLSVLCGWPAHVV